MIDMNNHLLKSLPAVILLIILISISPIYSQLPSNPIGSNPLHLKWHQIDTKNFQIIYPDYLDSQAIKVANIVDFILNQNDPSIGPKILKTPIILNPQSVRSNAFVTVGPYRSEIVTMPPQFDCTNDWIESVTIHEFRHAQQFGNSTQGLTNVVKKILGSWVWGGMMGLALPRWYFEGDAVFAETQHSFSGRGRLPAFHMEYKALALTGKDYSYEKASAGSFKDFVPDWYKLGYYMSSSAQENYGKDIWAKVSADAVRYKGLMYPFSRSLKKRTGLSTSDLYKKTITSNAKKWKTEVLNSKYNPSLRINKADKNTYTSYNNPIPIGEGLVLCEKSAFNEINSLQIVSNDGSENKISEPGIILDRPFSKLSYADSKICYARLGFDLRRNNLSFSDVCLYDLSTKKTRQLTSKQHYFSPSISHDGTKIAAVKINDQMQATLIILDASTGQIIKEFENKSKVMYIHPCWDSEDISIVVISKSDQKHSLTKIHEENGKEEILINPDYHQLSHPFVNDEYVYYSSSASGTNNIFAHNMNTGQSYQLTSVPLGAFQPSVSTDQRKLYYSEYDANGFNIQEAQLDSMLWKPVKKIKKINNPGFYSHQKFQPSAKELDSLALKSYPIKKYNKWSKILNPHSLIPLIDHPIAGLQILSDNTFSTLSAEAGAYYNYNENEWEYELGLNYAELFPIIHLSFVRSDRSSLFYNFNALSDTSLVQNIFVESWWENRLSSGFSLPFNFSKENYFNNLRLRANYRNISLTTEDQFSDPNFSQQDTFGQSQVDISSISSLYKKYIQEEKFHSFDVSVVYQSIKRRARQHIYPQWGYRFIIRYRDLLAEDEFTGSVINANADFFLPGLGKNHGILVNAAFQKEHITDNYRFSDVFIYPRGYDYSLRRDEFLKIGLNYSFPLFYPDKAIGPFAFIKRLKANVFYDHGLLKIRDFPFQASNEYIRSAGIELTLDFRALRLLEVDLGLRYSYTFDPELTPGQKKHHFDFLLLKIGDQ
jgi:hypothetical protein